MIDSKKQNPLKKTNLIQAGIKAQQQGKHKLALKRFRKAIEKNPKNRSAYMLTDKVWRELGEIEEANKYYYQLSETTPEAWEEEYILGLRVGYVKDSILIPLAGGIVQPHQGGIKTNINCPIYFYHIRGNFEQTTDINYLEQQDHQLSVKLHGTYLYAGLAFNHFGHYMSECTHRLWAYSQLSSQIEGVVILPKSKQKTRKNYKLSSYMEQAMTYMQIPRESINPILEVTEVEHLVVPEQASTVRNSLKLSSSYLDFLSENEEKFFYSYQPQNSNYPEKLYVSRSHLIDKGFIAGETYIENLLQKYESFHIFKPENYSLHEQMNFYRHAKVCIFSEGSAIHGLELLGRLNKMSKVAIICRRAGNDNLAQVIASRSQNLCQFKATKVIHPLLNHSTKVPWIANAVSIFSNIDLLIQFFRDNNLAQLKNFSLNDFYQQEAMDILQHVMQVKIDNNRFNSDAEFFSYFSQFRNDIRKYSQNPYLK